VVEDDAPPSLPTVSVRSFLGFFSFIAGLSPDSIREDLSFLLLPLLSPLVVDEEEDDLVVALMLLSSTAFFFSLGFLPDAS